MPRSRSRCGRRSCRPPRRGPGPAPTGRTGGPSPARLHIRLVELHDVGAGGEEIADLLVDRRGVVEGQLLLVAVEVVLGLLAHGERAGHRHLDGPVGLRPEELEVGHLDRVLAADLADDARHRVGMAAAIERGARVVEVDTLERGGEAVGVALAPDLAVGDDVEAGALLGADRQDRGVILRLGQVLRADTPQLGGAHARRKRPASLARSINHSGWAYEPTSDVGSTGNGGMAVDSSGARRSP